MVNDFDSQAGRDMPSPRTLTQAESDAGDQDVAAAVRGLASLMANADALEDVLAKIAEFAVAAVPRATGAGATLLRAGGDSPAVLAWAVTDPFVREIDHLQYDVCHEGPCLSAMQNKRAVVSGSLGSDDRWPRFGGRVARMKVHSVLSLPLIGRNQLSVGALNLYARDRDAFTERDVRLGERFAAPAAVAVGNIQLLHDAQTRATQLQAALTSRAVIDQAIGIVRSRSGGDAQEAFDRLRQISQAENVKLAVIAQRLVDEAVRRAHARHSQTPHR